MTNIATRVAYGQALQELASNENIVVLDADLSKSTNTAKFAEVSDRFVNVGIAEANMIGLATGLALCGRIPFVSTFAMFASGRAYEQIRNSVCYPNLPVKICATHSGISVGEDGASHQCLEDFALMRVLPNMQVFSPCDAVETKALVREISKTKSPCYVRMSRSSSPVINSDPYEFKIGKGIVLSEGKDIAIFATGLMVHIAINVAEALTGAGISASVINMPTIKPIDKELIIAESLKGKKIVVLEEHSVIGGLGGAISEVLSSHAPTHVKLIGLEDVFGQSGTPDELFKFYGLDPKSIYDKIVSWEVLNVQ